MIHMLEGQIKLNIINAVILGLAIFIVALLCNRFSYTFSSDSINMTYYFLWIIPVRSDRVFFKDILDIHPAYFEIAPWHIMGNLFAKQGLTIKVKDGLVRYSNIYISPKDPDLFIQELKRRISEYRKMNA